jgi:arabinofuranan 3-O-arabinosyltransferase
MTALVATRASPHDAETATDAPGTDPAVDRARRWALSIVLIVLSFSQHPGWVAADTKLDLSVNPWGFLTRAWHMWDPQGAFGQLQNQAYGYFFPMGPFFAAGHALGVPAWVVQRTWWALLLLLAFHGSLRVLERLGVGHPTARLLGALTFALAPRILGGIGADSAEVWPMTVAPWILLPLLKGAVQGSERKAAALSAVGVLCLGGINAVASGAALVLPAWFILSRERGPRRRRLGQYWALFTALAVLWWVAPLLLLGRYSPPFLDWIESSSVTTQPTGLLSALRGTTQWLAYLSGTGGPSWPAGFALVRVPLFITFSVVLTALAVGGLARRDLPERLFVVGGLVIGLVLVTFGHTGAFTAIWSADARSLLDGPLAALRNAHKFEPVIRLPLVAGLTHVLASVRLRPLRGMPSSRHGLVVVAALALVGISAPAFAGGIPQQGSFLEVPPYWSQAASWLAGHAQGGRALVVPGAAGAPYYWGNPRDEPLQPLATSSWAVRDGVPLGSAGNTRILDATELALSSGGSPGLAEFLARAGIEYVVARNDLDSASAHAPRRVVVREALQRSGGFSRVAYFGPPVGRPAVQADEVVDAGLEVSLPAIEVWQVDPYVAPAELWDAGSALDVTGGPESMLTLAERGLLADRPVVLDGDPLGRELRAAASLVTDGYRRREFNPAAVHDNYSATLTRDEPWTAARGIHDYEPFPPAGVQTVARYLGVTALTASSSGSQATALLSRNPAFTAYAAFDHDPATSWRSGASVGAVGQWVEITFDRPMNLAQVTVTLPDDQGVARASVLRLSTDQGTTTAEVRSAPGQPQLISVVSGETRRLRVTVEAVQPHGAGLPAAISDISIPGVSVQRTMVTPNPGTTRPPASTYLFDVAAGSHSSCVFLGDRPLCSLSLAAPAEEDQVLDRTFTVRRPQTVSVSGTVSPVGSAYLARLLLPLGEAIVAEASSTLTPDPAVRAQAAVDADLGTAWIAAARDTAPTLDLSWPGQRLVSGVQLLSDAALAASRPTAVVVKTSTGSAGRRLTVDPEGYVRFAPLLTNRLSLQVVATHPTFSLDPRTLRRSLLPTGISEVRVLGADDLRRGIDLNAPTALPCGFAPEVEIDGRRYPTEASGTLRDLLELLPLSLRLCGPEQRVALAAGQHRIRLVASAEAQPSQLSLTSTLVEPAPRLATPDIRQWSAEDRVLAIPSDARPRVLVVHENSNAGWQAVLQGQTLRTVRVDGWQQGWLVPAGMSGVLELRYEPGTWYRAGLLLGLLAIVALLAGAVLPGVSRRPPLQPTSARGWAVLPWLGMFCLAGWWGLGALGLARAGGRLAEAARRLTWLPVLAGGLLALAGLVLVAAPARQFAERNASVTQSLSLLALALVLVPAARGRRPVQSVLESQGGGLDQPEREPGDKHGRPIGQDQSPPEATTEDG